MTTDKELLLAVLSMDSYNRGYEPGIQDLGEAGTKVGKATIIDVDLPVNAQSNGFYAAAYAVDGQIVIAYHRQTFRSHQNLHTEKYSHLAADPVRAVNEVMGSQIAATLSGYMGHLPTRHQ